MSRCTVGLLSALLIPLFSLDPAPDDWKALELFAVADATAVEPSAYAKAVEKVAEERRPTAYRAEVHDPRSEDVFEATLVFAPLGDPFDGGKLAAAIDGSGDIRAIDLIGHDRFAKDDFMTWFSFLLQFLANPSMGTEAFREPMLADGGPPTLSAFLDDADKDDRAELAFLAEQLQVMKRNRLLLFHVQQVVTQGQDVEAAWFADQRAAMASIKDADAVLEKHLGRAAAGVYHEHMQAMDASLALLEETASSDDFTVDVLAERARGLAKSCSACHDAPSATEGMSVSRVMIEAREEAKLPRGLFEVGFDVTVAPGLAEKEAAVVATALRDAARIARVLRDAPPR